MVDAIWTTLRSDRRRPGTIFHPADRQRYRFQGHRTRLTVNGPLETSQAAEFEVLEYEPIWQPDDPAVYLAIPVFPATDWETRSWTGQLVAALAEKFDLIRHTASWPGRAVAFGLIVAAVDPQSGWWMMRPYTHPGIEIAVAWLRDPHRYDLSWRTPDREFPAGQVTACLGHQLPAWPAGTNDSATVAAWEPGDPVVECPIPATDQHTWLVCQYALLQVDHKSGRGFAELAVLTHAALADEPANTGDVPGDTGWAWAARVEPPPPLPALAREQASLVAAVNLALGSPDTPPQVGEAMYRLFGDPMRGQPVIVSRNMLPAEVQQVIDTAPTTDAITPRDRRLLDLVRERLGHGGWQLRRRVDARTDQLYATTDDHLAWLPVIDQLQPHRGHALLPDRPHQVLLVRDEAGNLGGWVSTPNLALQPLPLACGATGESSALAALVTGRPFGWTAGGSPGARLLRNLRCGSSEYHTWASLTRWAQQLPDHDAVTVHDDEVLPFVIDRGRGDRGQDLVPTPITSCVVTPPAARLPFQDLSPARFENLVADLALTHDRVDASKPYGRSGQPQNGIDVYCHLAAPRASDRQYLTIECKNHRTIEGWQIRRAVTKFLDGWWAARTEVFVFATSAPLDDTGLDEVIVAEQQRLHHAGGIGFWTWDGADISKLLTSHPRIMAGYFTPFGEPFKPRTSTSGTQSVDMR